MLHDAMARDGYNQEEHYFFELNQKLKEQLRKDALRKGQFNNKACVIARLIHKPDLSLLI